MRFSGFISVGKKPELGKRSFEQEARGNGQDARDVVEVTRGKARHRVRQGQRGGRRTEQSRFSVVSRGKSNQSKRTGT